MPILMLQRELKEGGVDDSPVEILSDDRAFPDDVKAWCEHHGHVLISVFASGTSWLARVRRKQS
jgi:TusA-related sulfurtransferase